MMDYERELDELRRRTVRQARMEIARIFTEADRKLQYLKEVGPWARR